MITLETQVPINRARCEQITIQLKRDGAEATATVTVLDANGAMIRQEIVQHPNPNAFVKTIIPNPQAAFDTIESLLTGLAKYRGTTSPNTDVAW